jgi:flagellar protein FlaG
MNEIGMQQAVTAKPRSSAPDGKSVDGSKDSAGAKAVSASSVKVNAEVNQTEQPTMSAVEEFRQQQDAKKEEIVEKAVAKLNDYVQSTERKLEFQVDDDSGHTVVKVYDKNSEELIRQIPNEEALELAQKLNQEEPLMLFSAQV